MRSVNVQIPSARRVLDLGCGTGWVVAEADISGHPFCVGVDYSVDVLQEAKRHQSIAFAAADGLMLPFPADCFDIVVGHVSMPYMNTEKAFAEIYRVMTPGGSFFLTFHSFRHIWERIPMSARRGHWKDVIFSMYAGINGVLNHFSLPQMQAWWNKKIFETVNTARGVHNAACKAGFSLVSTEHSVQRIFFAATARKPNPETGEVLPEPGWSIYCRLRAEARARAMTTTAGA
ncbi:MAG: class I SAM-dependent methyltransferase [Acidobacteriaceae bacterium]|nr:class I SAM-dependent methyltransferase [Acidobacteriaceae bacterium]